MWCDLACATSNLFFLTRRWHIGVYGRFRTFFQRPKRYKDLLNKDPIKPSESMTPWTLWTFWSTCVPLAEEWLDLRSKSPQWCVSLRGLVPWLGLYLGFWKGVGFLWLFFGWLMEVKWNITPNMLFPCVSCLILQDFGAEIRNSWGNTAWFLLTWLAGKSTMNKDVFPIENADFPASHLSFQGCRIG